MEQGIEEAEDKRVPFHNDHNIYIVGAGFSYEAGYPLIRNFMEKMRETAIWQEKNSRETKEIEAVLKIRLEAAPASLRVQLDPDNVEDLFSLTAATENTSKIQNQNMLIAIAETLEYCRIHSHFEPVIFPGSRTSLPKGFKSDNEENPMNSIIDPYKFFIGLMTGVWGDTPFHDNTFISFNYDLLLESSLREWNIPYRYEGLHGFEISGAETPPRYDDSARSIEQNAVEENSVSILKLHGSLNWAATVIPVPVRQILVKIYGGQVPMDVLRSGQIDLLLAPPIWDKGTARIGHPLSGIWSSAIKKLQTATRIIVIGYSLPSADAHFRYLMAAGLQHNISLKEIVFVNPDLAENRPQREELETRIYSVFKNDLNQKGMVKPIGLSARSFFLHAGYAGSILNRKYPFPNYPPMGIGALTDSDAWEAMSRGDSEGTGLGGI
jgi:hypothetical protein